ncbi:MAG: PPOX class F420-dependent oxidoreductase [Acidobacteriota bacterium]|nr:PPOX class F420-dependent oxidoreductase [Acidobacteriota bacterium]
MSDKLEQFANQNYFNLESYRKSGEAIRTPLWFVQDGDTLYFYTVAHSFKVTRLKNNPRCRVASCDIRGNLKGEWVDASARLLDTAEASRADNLLNQKYGLSKRILNFFAKLRGHKRAAFAITLD